MASYPTTFVHGRIYAWRILSENASSPVVCCQQSKHTLQHVSERLMFGWSSRSGVLPSSQMFFPGAFIYRRLRWPASHRNLRKTWSVWWVTDDPKPAVLNLLRLKEHFVNFVSVSGPPLKIVQLAHSGWSNKPYKVTLLKMYIKIIVGLLSLHRNICFLLLSDCFTVTETIDVKNVDLKNKRR